MTTGKIIHHLIAKTAKEICAAAYEQLARNNEFYKKWPTQKLFVRRTWDVFIPDARMALVEILKGDYPEQMKGPVYEALLLDGGGKADGAAQKRSSGLILH